MRYALAIAAIVTAVAAYRPKSPSIWLNTGGVGFTGGFFNYHPNGTIFVSEGSDAKSMRWRLDADGKMGDIEGKGFLTFEEDTGRLIIDPESKGWMFDYWTGTPNANDRIGYNMNFGSVFCLKDGQIFLTELQKDDCIPVTALVSEN